jgi:alpha-galactosidase
LIERFNIPLDEYMRRCEVQIKTWRFMQDNLENDVSPSEDEVRRVLEDADIAPAALEGALRRLRNIAKVESSDEYAALAIHSLETGTPHVIYGNVPNRGLIDNLPQECCVEVPCLVDKNGVQPTRVGLLPPHLAALMQTNINVQAMVVEAFLTRKREYIYYAAMLDPHTAAELDLDQIWALVDDLIEAHGDWLPAFTDRD